MLIAGGEPLTHPQIINVTKIVKEHNVKPVIVTNGVGLDTSLVQELKRAGAYGFTIHVDSHQSRPGWEGKNEKELNELRQYFSDMLNKEGGLVCAFNTTIFPDTLKYVPDIIRWAAQNIKKVNILTLIAVRMVGPDWPFDYYVDKRKVDLSKMAYFSSNNYKNLTTLDIYKEVKKVLPNFELCAYLGGKVLPHSLKWTLGCHIGTSKMSFGCMGARTMELLQNLHHFMKGRYLAYTNPSLNRKAKLLVPFSLFDSEIRNTARNYFLSALKNPILLFKKLYTQSINILQPVDILPDGEEDMCDGCPNKTYWKGKLVSACRWDDYEKFGAPVHLVPKSEKIV
jgi:MoaA/NifB/PqqE/SkfB family radical SAM enzyme